MKIITAVILAGGEGSRLWPLTKDIPKALVEVGGRPILYWKIQWLKRYGIKHLVLGVGHKKGKIYEFMRANNNFGLDVDISEHTVEGGTAEGMYLAITRFVKDDNYIVLNGDDILNVDIDKIVKKHITRNALMTMGLGRLIRSSGIVEVENDTVSSFKYGYEIPGKYVGNGIYIFNKAMKDHLVQRGSAEELVFSRLAKEKKIVPFVMSEDEIWISIDSKKDLDGAEREREKWMKKFA